MILITGATGLVGSHLAFELLKKEEKIIALKRKTSNIEKLKTIFSFYTDKDTANKYFNRIEWREADLLNIYEIYEALEGISMIYHTAAIVSFEKKHGYDILFNNVNSTANLVNAALDRKVEKFIHVSSVASLGDNPNGLITEDTHAIPEQKLSFYSKSKYYSELEVWRAQQEGLNTIILNPSVILGPLADWKSKVIGKVLFLVWEGLPFYVNVRTGFVDVRDVVKAMSMLAEKEVYEQRFIISAENLYIKELLDIIAETMGKPKPKYLINKYWIKAVYWLEQICSKFNLTDPILTKEYLNYVNIDQRFSSEKLLRTLPDFKYIPINDTINFIVNLFLESLSEKEKKQKSLLSIFQ